MYMIYELVQRTVQSFFGDTKGDYPVLLLYLLPYGYSSILLELEQAGTLGGEQPKTNLRKLAFSVARCVELAVNFHWLKRWARTVKGKLSSTGICASFMKPKRQGIPVFY